VKQLEFHHLPIYFAVKNFSANIYLLQEIFKSFYKLKEALIVSMLLHHYIRSFKGNPSLTTKRLLLRRE